MANNCSSNKRGLLWAAAGLLLIAAALALVCYNLLDNQRAARAAQQALAELEAAEAAQAQSAPAQPEAEPVPTGGEMPTIEIDGHAYIGTLSIPALGLTLPVMEEWSYPNLKLAPCRYVGSAYDGNLVISAHNYEKHFGNLRQLQPGDTITFADVKGNLFSYAVAEVEVLAPTALESMVMGDWDLTLFTCTLGGKTRLTVRCARQ